MHKSKAIKVHIYIYGTYLDCIFLKSLLGWILFCVQFVQVFVTPYFNRPNLFSRSLVGYSVVRRKYKCNYSYKILPHDNAGCLQKIGKIFGSLATIYY